MNNALLRHQSGLGNGFGVKTSESHPKAGKMVFITGRADRICNRDRESKRGNVSMVLDR